MYSSDTLRTPVCSELISGNTSWKSNVRRISTALPITNTLATCCPRAGASSSPVYQSCIRRWPSIRGSNGVSAAPTVGAASRISIVMAFLLLGGKRKQQGFGKGLELHRHLLERGHLFLEFEHQVLDMCLVEVLGPSDLFVEPGFAELCRGEDRGIGLARANHLHQIGFLGLALVVLHRACRGAFDKTLGKCPDGVAGFRNIL